MDADQAVKSYPSYSGMTADLVNLVFFIITKKQIITCTKELFSYPFADRIKRSRYLIILTTNI